MRGIDEASNYDPRNVSKIRGSSWQVYKRLVGNVWRYKARLAVSILFALVVAFSFGTVIVTVGTAVKLLFNPDAKVQREVASTVEKIDEATAAVKRAIGWAPEGLGDRYQAMVASVRATNESKMRALLVLSAAVVLLAAVSGAARFTQEYLAASVATFVTIELGEQMYRNLMRLSVRFFEEHPSGEIVARLSNDVFMAGRGLTNVFMKIFREPFIALTCFGIAVYTDWTLTLVGVGVLPVVGYVLVTIGRKMRKSVRRSLEKVASLVAVAKESFTGIYVVKGFCMEAHETALVENEYKKLKRQGLKMLRAEAAVGPLTEFVLVVGLVGFVLLSGYRVVVGKMDGGDLVMLYLPLIGMLDPVRKLASLNNAVQTSVAGAQRAYEFIDIKPDVVEAKNALEVPRLADALRFEDVRFSYDGRTEVLKGVSFEIKKGEMVALVGFSGGGKSTIAKLIPRFYDVTGGAVTIDGVDVRQATFASLRGQFAIVTQDTVLFDDTVRANIVAGRPDFPEERIRAAAKAAHAAEFIEALPRGYDTSIGEAGNTLSGGQRQRLAIARALLRDPAILILDEATSSLDSESEQAIQQAIEEFVVGRTTLVIAHRLSTVQRANRILVIADGQIIEQGSHEELLTRDGSLYRRLYETQFAAAPEASAPEATA